MEATIKIFDRNPDDGTDRLPATYTLTGARIASARLWLAPASAGGTRLCEEVQIAYGVINIAYSGDTQTEAEIDVTGSGV